MATTWVARNIGPHRSALHGISSAMELTCRMPESCSDELLLCQALTSTDFFYLSLSLRWKREPLCCVHIVIEKPAS